MTPWAMLVVGCVLALGACMPGAFAAELDARFKWFGSQAFLPEHDRERQRYGTPAFDDNFDLRVMLEAGTARLRFNAAHGTIVVRGNGAGRLQSGLDRPVDDDDRRLADLTWQIDAGDRHQAVHRLDRLAIEYRGLSWSAKLGREAVSWGNGLVFQPMDLFNPFAPTAVDRDYKPGDDLLLLERVYSNGSDLQLLAVGRRDETGNATGAAGSLAAKWRGAVAARELELLAARHYRDRVYGLAVRGPWGGAVWRTDLVVTDLDTGGREVSGVANLDYSLAIRGRNLYVFGEYFRNGFGLTALPETPAGYPEALRERLARGELFSLMRDYLALGSRLELNARWSQALTLFGNLQDGSTLVQAQLDFDRGDHQRMQFGLAHPLGRRGDEFGGVPVMGTDSTLGGGTRVYVRFAHYF
jgi:hypothetical protein